MNARRVALLLALLLGVYLVVLGDRGITLVRDGRPAFVLLGVGVLLFPVVGLVILVLEMRFGQATERLGRRLGEEGGLPPADEVPRRPSGRVDRDAADAVFERRRAEVEAAPEDWRAWFRLAIAYSDAGDGSRARRAMRRAIVLHDRPPTAGPPAQG